MKKQNWVFFPFIIAVEITLFGCDFKSAGNSQTFQNSPAVVDWRTDMGGTVIGTPYGYLAAPSLTDVSEGDCLYLYQFMLDYDNQPSNNYYTATNIVKDVIDQSPFEETFDTAELGVKVIGDYSLPLSSVTSMADEFFMGRFFVGATCKDKNPSFRLIYNSKEEETNDIKNFYLLAKPSSSTESASNASTINAFNLLSFIQYNGRDTSKTFKGSTDKFDFRYIRVNLKYISKITDGEPEYATLNDSNQPIEIYVFSN